MDGNATGRGSLPGDIVGGESQLAGSDADVGAVHAGGAIVVGAPGIVVGPVGVECGLRVEGCAGDFPAVAGEEGG